MNNSRSTSDKPSRVLLGRTITLLAAITFIAVVGEVTLRLFTNEVNYLIPELKPHPFLGHVVEPGSSGHDRWGFRNDDVPATANIVAIGDSITYGVSATADRSWPAWLARVSGRSVYNLALGGYGPPDYQYLFNTRGRSLSPELFLIGFYFGNDLRNSYEYAIGRKSTAVDFTRHGRAKLFGGIREWLSRHSVTYQLLKFTVEHFVDFLRFQEEYYRFNSETLTFPVDSGRWKTWFKPTKRFVYMDQSRKENQIGLSKTLEIFFEIASDCREIGTACVFVLLPTKESVYWPIARDLLTEAGRQNVGAAVAAEQAVRKHMIAFFEQEKIQFIDPLPAMQRAARSLALYPANSDGHPNSQGYNVLAQIIYEAIKDML